MVTPYLPLLRAQHEALMTETVRVLRGGSIIHASVPARLTQERQSTEQGDPHDATLRGTHEYGATLPYTYTDVREGDVVERTDGSLSFIVGEVIAADTWILAVRLWGTRPKVGTNPVAITLYRYSTGTDDFVIAGTYTVQLQFARTQSLETPVRFSPDVQASMQEGSLIGDLSFAPELDDRFTYGGYAFVIDQILPGQPQHIEAHFVMDAVGAR